MSLVAYEASSGEESDNEDYESKLGNNNISSNTNGNDASAQIPYSIKSLSLPPPVKIDTMENVGLKEQTVSVGNISDDVEYNSEPKSGSVSNHKGIQTLTESIENEKNVLSFVNLPTPKVVCHSQEIVEEDDEYLHKKAAPHQFEKPSIPKRGPVKIMIPSLSEFKDVEKDNKKMKADIGPTPKICGLLNLLPKPKHEQFLSTADSSQVNNPTVKKSLIPDSVKNRQTNITKKIQNPPKQQGKKSLIANTTDSEGSDSDEDFFSLNSTQELPEVSLNEINSMVAKKAAHMAETTSKFELFAQIDKTEDNPSEIVQSEVKEDIRFDEKALHALVGSRAKRRKVEVNVVELSSEQVLPDKNEWLRTALAQATTYQPKGVLVDEEPVPGTRKKHQITYLAHQAKANEQELQAMWATNRHTRRQTQSKYGF